MRKQIVVIAVVLPLVLLATVVAVRATVCPKVVADIPFAFQIGNTSLPAGVYSVEMERLGTGSALGSTLTVRDASGAPLCRVMANPSANRAFQSGAKLVFRRYNTQYFLAQVESYGLGCQLAKSRVEKELARRVPLHQMAAVPASAR